jgi:hypothetical protein
MAGMLLMLFAAIWIYNRLIADRNQMLSAWSDIDVQLMRRHQLVPQLVNTVKAIEDHIQYARRFYNGAVRLLNTRIQSFPHLLLARPLGFRAAEFFEVSRAHERAAPTLDKH